MRGNYSIRDRLNDELVFLGLPVRLADKISCDLSGTVESTIKNKMGDQMVTNLGYTGQIVFVSSRNVTKKVLAVCPEKIGQEVAIASISDRYSSQHPAWNEDQVAAAVIAYFKAPAGTVVAPPPVGTVQVHNKRMFLVVGAVGVLVLVAFLAKKR